MTIVKECLPIIILAACLVYLCITVKVRGMLFVLSLIYLAIQIVYKALLLFVWPAVAIGNTDIYNLIGAGLTIVNYVLLFVMFGYILRHRAQYSDQAADHKQPPA